MMARDHDIKPFLDNPSLLTETFREVIEALDSSGEDDVTQEKEAQLREIAKSVERLEKAGVPVPDALRAEKTRLASAVDSKGEDRTVLIQLADQMETVLKDLRRRIGQGNQQQGKKRAYGKRSSTPKTGKDVLRNQIIKALRKFGGSAQASDVIAEIGRQLEGKLLPGDLEWRNASNSYAWQHNTHWERYQMVQEGLLKSDSKRGVWELSEDHR